MARHDARTRADRLRALHVPGDPLLLVNTWDVASARVVATSARAKAIATASWSVSAALGVTDGEGMAIGQVLDLARRIVEAVDLPLTVDFEKGYARDGAGLAANIEALLESGAVGLNLEDSLGAEDGSLWPIEEAASRIATVREAAERVGVPVVINARTDVLVGGGTADDALARGRAYLEAGADCIFMLGAAGDDLRRIVMELPGPVSVMAVAGAPTLPELARTGVARVSLGPGSMGVAYSALAALATSLANGAEPPAELGFRP